MTRSPLRALLGALLATAVTGSVLTASLASPADAATATPEVGDCHSLTAAEIAEANDTDVKQPRRQPGGDGGALRCSLGFGTPR